MTIRTALALSLALAMAVPASAACETPSFQAMIPSITATSDITDLVFGDLGNDGDLDLVTVSESVTEFGVEVHIDDDGFLPPFAVAGSRPTAVALADMNGDGQLDIVITEKAANSEECRLFGSCASLREIRVGANGGFTDVSEPRVIPFIDSVKRIVAADFNKDGEMDVLVAGPPINGGDPSLHLIWGTDPDSGTIASSTIQTFNTNGPIADVVIGDFDNDTFVDFAAAVGKSDLTTASHVDLYRNEAGAFTGVAGSHDIPSHDSTLRLTTGQFNRTDTRLDIAVAMKTSTLFKDGFVGGGVAIVLSTGNSLIGGGMFATSPGNYLDAAAADADEDNDLDVALGGTAFFYNNGNSNLTAQDGSRPTGSALRVFGADFNRDGRDDVAYLASSRSVAIFLNACPSRYRALTLSASPSPSTFGGSATFTVNVTVKPNAPMATGEVTLLEGTTVIGTGNINSAGNAIITLSNLSIGNHTLKARHGSIESNTITHTVNRPPFGAPLNIVATGNTAANAIIIRWISTADVSTHQVLRRNDLGQWHTVGSTSMEQFTDSTVDPTRAYVYSVRSVHATNGTVSANGNLDVATTMNPVRPSDKIIRAADTTDVRSLAQSLRRAAGLAAFTFTDATLTGVQVKAVHLTELRTAIAQARSALGLPPVAFSQPTITPKVTKVRFNDLQELRTSFH
jgi:hypothetical protein